MSGAKGPYIFAVVIPAFAFICLLPIAIGKRQDIGFIGAMVQALFCACNLKCRKQTPNSEPETSNIPYIMLISFTVSMPCRKFAAQRINAMETLQTTLFLIPGGRELALPENSDNLRAAMKQSIAAQTAKLLMLADNPLVSDEELQSISRYKTVLAIEANDIWTHEDAWARAYEVQADNYLPVIADAGFDFQVVQMRPVAIKYEDFELLEKYM